MPKLFYTEELVFRFNDETGEYKVLEISINAGNEIFITAKKGIKDEEEGREIISFKLNDKEILKFILIVEKIKDILKEDIFR